MLGQLKISMKIGLANAILLFLLFGLGGVSVVSLQSTLTKFEDVKLLTQTTNLASDFQSEMLGIEVAVANYLLKPNEDAQNLVLSSIESLRQKIIEAEQQQIDGEILGMYQTLQSGLVEYEAAFNNVTEKEIVRANLVTVDLSSIGANIDTNVFALMDTVSLEGDADLTFMAGESYRNFSAFLLSIKEFLNSNDAVAYEKSLKQLARFEKGFAKLDKQLEVKRHKGYVKKTNRDLKKFITILDATKVIIADRNQLIQQELKSAAQSVGVAVSELKEKVLYRQAEISNEAEENVNGATHVSVVVSIISAAFALLMAFLLARGIAKPIVSMTEAMVGLSEGNMEMEVPAKGRRDEIGSMAEAVQVFKDNALRVGELEKQREHERAEAEADKAQVMSDLADDFEGSVGEIVQAVSSRSSKMHEIAKSLADISQETSGRATAVANSAESVSNDIQTVASAAEELSVSIQEINQQVERSAVISSQAVENAATTSNMVEGLEETAGRVSNVVQLINEIAEQTNLLALNATIEAARAGDAGKGFAVVANEVKSLATQTAKATGEISGQITDMQNATTDMVGSIKEISDSIEQMNSISSMVAGAIIEQGAATHEIAQNVQGVSSGTQDVSSIIAEVSTAASKSGSETEIALSAAEELSDQAERLQTELSRYLAQIRMG